MWDTFLFAFNAVTPMLLLMLLGAWLKHRRFFDDATLKKMNAFTFRFGILAMMFRNIYSLGVAGGNSPQRHGRGSGQRGGADGDGLG